MTFGCVDVIINGVPFGAHIAWLSNKITGIPPANTRVALVTNCAIRQGLGVVPATNGQPATVYGVGCVATGCPFTNTRGLEEDGIA
jgi:hypothetical protein